MNDRESLRTEILRGNADEQVHLPINVARLIWNAKSQFGITQHSKSDLKPDTVVRKVNQLINSLSVLPGAKSSGSKLLLDADLNSRRLFNIYLRHALCAKNIILD
jgi:DNA-directed RNA polymerase II subunit RPB1